MKYTVKNKDGELTYGSLEEVKTAYVLGLIDADDDILEDGAKLARKAGAIPLLITARKVRVHQGQSNTLRGWIFGALVLSIIGFYLLVTNSWLLGGLAMVVVASMLFRITALASRRKKV